VDGERNKMNVTAELNAFIAEHGGERDALVVALTRLYMSDKMLDWHKGQAEYFANLLDADLRADNSQLKARLELATSLLPFPLQVCKTCKFWNGTIFPDGSTWLGSCNLIDDTTQLARIRIETKYPEFIDAAVVDTTAEFGCNQWQKE